MREIRTPGSVRGAARKGRPYRYKSYRVTNKELAVLRERVLDLGACVRVACAEKLASYVSHPLTAWSSPLKLDFERRCSLLLSARWPG